MGLIQTIIRNLCKVFGAYKNCPIIEQEVEKYKQQIQQLKQYYNDRIKTLTSLLALSLTPPEIKLQEVPVLIQSQKIYNLLYQQIPTLLQCEFADVGYYSLSKDTFENILKQINEAFLNKVQYTLESFDCDDFALLMSALTTYTAYKILKLKHQLAVGIAWSDVHAFNIYIDKNNTVWIWEPQLAKTVSKASEPPENIYRIRMVWFMS